MKFILALASLLVAGVTAAPYVDQDALPVLEERAAPMTTISFYKNHSCKPVGLVGTGKYSQNGPCQVLNQPAHSWFSPDFPESCAFVPHSDTACQVDIITPTVGGANSCNAVGENKKVGSFRSFTIGCG